RALGRAPGLWTDEAPSQPRRQSRVRVPSVTVFAAHRKRRSRPAPLPPPFGHAGSGPSARRRWPGLPESSPPRGAPAYISTLVALGRRSPAVPWVMADDGSRARPGPAPALQRLQAERWPGRGPLRVLGGLDVPPPPLPTSAFTKIPLRELADARLRDRVDEDDVVGQPPLGHPALEERDDVLLRGLLARTQYDA